jgi:hypothetical protein
MTATRREVLAFIALQDLPMPSMVHFHTGGVGVGLTFDSIAVLADWVILFSGHELTDYRSRFTEDSTGRPMLGANSGADWRGRHLYMNANDYVDAEPLAEDTASKLREIAEPDEGGAS